VWIRLRRAVVSTLVVGLVFGVTLLLSRQLLGGRPVPFWLENTAGIWFVAAFVAGAIVRGPLAGATAGAGALVLGLVLHDVISFTTGEGFLVQFFPVLRVRWLIVSVAVGATVGAAAGWAAGVRKRWLVVTGVVGGLLVGEAAALFVGGPPHAAFDARIGAAQAALGTAGVLLAVPGPGRWRALATTAAVASGVVAVEIATGLVSRLVWG
jgi:hypothetical protein